MNALGRSLLLSLALAGPPLRAAPDPRGMAPLPPPGRTSEDRDETLVARVRSVDSGKAMVDLLTGCGHSLRILRIMLIPETRISRDKQVIRPANLQGGMLLRITFHRDGDGNHATTVEVMGPGEGP